ncbi:unnamed protein product [Chrysoparadoxa australica]
MIEKVIMIFAFPYLTIDLTYPLLFYLIGPKFGLVEDVGAMMLAVFEKALKVDHPSYATTLNHLASLHKAQGKYDAAGPLFKKALEVYEKVSGVDRQSIQ